MRERVSTLRAWIRPWAMATKMTVRARPEGTSRVRMMLAPMRPIMVLVKEEPIRIMLCRAMRLPRPVRLSTWAMMRAEKHIHGRKVHQLEKATAGLVTKSAYRNVRMAATIAEGRISTAQAMTAHRVIARKSGVFGLAISISGTVKNTIRGKPRLRAHFHQLPWTMMTSIIIYRQDWFYFFFR